MENKAAPKLHQIKDTVNTSWQIIKIVWQMDARLLIQTLVGVLIPAITPFIIAYIFKLIIDLVAGVLIGHPLDYSQVYWLLGLSVGVSYLNMLAFAFQDYTTQTLYTKLPIRMSEIVLNKVATLDLEYFENSEFNDKLQKVRDSLYTHPQQLVYQLSFFIQSVAGVAISLIAIIHLNVWLTLLISLVAVPDLINRFYFSKSSWGIWHHNTPERKKMWYLLRLINNEDSIKELKIFQTGKNFVKDLIKTQLKFFNENQQNNKRELKATSGLSLIDTAVSAGILFFIVTQAIARKITVGDISFYSNVTSNFNNNIGGLFRTLSRIFEESLYVKDIFEVLKLSPKVMIKENPVKIDFNEPHQIEFVKIGFRYPGSQKDIFKDFSLVIEKGQKIALVGENGSGKTTLIKLLARFYDVNAGQILIDGIDLKDLDLESWQRCLGVLFQDFIKYDYSASDNIYFGRTWEDRKPDKIIDAARSSGAHEMISNFDKGYDQILGKIFDEGLALSGGQWQKIALARAFFRNAPILILDEPTAAIDAKAESEIFERVEKLSKDKTVIIISHRFSTVRNADKVYVIDKGKITEQGSHQQLMKLDGQYAKLFNLQAKGYR